MFYKNKITILNSFIIPHFLIQEFRCKCGKCKLTLIEQILLDALCKTRKEYNKAIVIISGFRCQEHNRSILLSATYSYHMQGLAVDIFLPTDKNDRETLIAIAQKYFNVVRVYPEKNFMHCDMGKKRTW